MYYYYMLHCVPKITLFYKRIIIIFQVQNLDETGMDLLQKMLVYDPVRRISAKDARRHRYFRDVKLPPGLATHTPYIRYTDGSTDTKNTVQSV